METKENDYIEENQRLKNRISELETRYKDFERLSQYSLSEIKNSKKYSKGNRADQLRHDISNYIKNLPEEEKKIEELQQYLTQFNSNYQFKDNKIKSPFSFKFGDVIDNKKFYLFMKEGLSTLYSNNKKVSEKAFDFFKNIENEIKNFIYIPMLNNSSLSEFKKHIYLGALTNQIEENDYKSIAQYIFYTDEYFNESNYEEITFTIERNDSFVDLFKEYDKNHTFKLDLEKIKSYIFSETIIEAYIETCKDIFGEDANFVNKKNIKSALENIYEEIIKKNIRIVQLEKGYFGVTIYSKKIFISNGFIRNIKDISNLDTRVTYLAGLVKTILHEIMYCLTNYLPLYSDQYIELSNPFIRTYKKNVKVYDYVVGNIEYQGAKDSLEILQNVIKDYQLIVDSGRLFENKLFGNNNETLNYIISEYFLNTKNLSQSLNDFRKNLKNFEDKADKYKELKLIKDKTSVSFKSLSKFLYLGSCILDSKRPNFMK